MTVIDQIVPFVNNHQIIDYYVYRNYVPYPLVTTIIYAIVRESDGCRKKIIISDRDWLTRFTIMTISDVRQRFNFILGRSDIYRDLQQNHTDGGGVHVERDVLPFRHVNRTEPGV